MTQLNTIDQKVKIDPMREMLLGGVNRSTVYRWIKTQQFPAPIKLSPCCSVWSVSKVEAWLESREALNVGEVA
jgi:predicted DNA-binding transcriptional regulator AlpA